MEGPSESPERKEWRGIKYPRRGTLEVDPNVVEQIEELSTQQVHEASWVPGVVTL